MTRLELTGLKANHPLGFLAACGLFRVTSDYLQTRLCWSHTARMGSTRVACLCTDTVETQSELRTRVIEKVVDSARRYLDCLKEYALTETEMQVDEFSRVSKEISHGLSAQKVNARMASELITSLGSDLSSRKKSSGKKKGQIVIGNSHLLMTSGPQDLLKHGGLQPAVKLAGQRTKKGIGSSKVDKKVKEVLFGPWRYEDHEHSLGWDPEMQRIHALRNKEPTNDSRRRSVGAAIFLASQAIPLFPCFVVNRRLCTTGFHQDKADEWFSWPVWRDPICLDTLRSLLGQRLNAELKRRGVEVVYRCRRVRSPGSAEGNYQVFSHAEEWQWPRY